MFIYAARDVYMAYRALFGQMKTRMKQGKEVKTYDFSVNHTYGCNITGFSSDAEHPLPVCFAGALLFLSLFGDVSMKTMLIWVFSQSTGTVLLASPLFILAGTYMGGSGIAKRLLDCVDAFVGHIKSGLGVVAVLVCAIMGPYQEADLRAWRLPALS